MDSELTTRENAVRLRLVCRHCGEVYFSSSPISLHADCAQLTLPPGLQPRMKFLATAIHNATRPYLFGITEEGSVVVWSWPNRTWVLLSEYGVDD